MNSEEPDIVAVLMGRLKCAGKRTCLTQGAQGSQGRAGGVLSVDFSMGGIEILQSSDGARSGSMEVDH